MRSNVIVVSIVLSLASNGPTAAQTYDQLRQWCYGNSTDDQCIQGCEAVIKSGKESVTNQATAFNFLGVALLANGQSDRALQNADQAIRLRPDYAGAFFTRGRVFNHKGQYDRAIQDFDQAIKLSPSNAGPFIARGDAFSNKNQYDRAIQDYDQAIKLNPNHPGTFVGRGNAFSAKGQFDRAIQDFDQAIKLQPDNYRAFYNRGLFYVGRGQFDRAIQDYDQAIKLNPGNAPAFNSRCWARAIKGQQLEAALADCNEALRLKPNDSATLDSRGFTYLKLKLNSAAISDYDAALKITPDRAASLFGRGVARHRTGDRAGGDADIAAAKKIQNNIADDFAKWGVADTQTMENKVNPESGSRALELPAQQSSKNVAPPALAFKAWNFTSGALSQPMARICVESGYKLIGGGAKVNWSGAGNLLTASYPDGNCWVAQSKDHVEQSPGSVTAWAIGIHDPANEWDVLVQYATGPRADHPTATATLPSGYALTGGGGRTHWSGAGSLLTASYPTTSNTWEVRAKDHSISDPTDAMAYVIGIRPRNGTTAPQVMITSNSGASAQHPSASVDVAPGFQLVGGGARVNWAEPGNLLTASYPGESSWKANAKDHLYSSPANVSVYAIGLKY
jgi:tetratricopeptide (TPR) repeat protein